MSEHGEIPWLHPCNCERLCVSQIFLSVVVSEIASRIAFFLLAAP